MSNISALQRAYDRMEPPDDDGYDEWFESTSFVDMLPESAINDVLWYVYTKQYDLAHRSFNEAVAKAWKQFQADCEREAGEAVAGAVAGAGSGAVVVAVAVVAGAVAGAVVAGAVVAGAVVAGAGAEALADRWAA